MADRLFWAKICIILVVCGLVSANPIISREKRQVYIGGEGNGYDNNNGGVDINNYSSYGGYGGYGGYGYGYGGYYR
ncbi:hypothetical protein AB6A40_003005 [Gnathostoma spinigerum]|uniref:Glycine-rich protein n=1 Tax=Gnathostoma spinigerum TaxID=75299 RepID=A0ABD6E9J5_9BILA